MFDFMQSKNTNEIEIDEEKKLRSSSAVDMCASHKHTHTC